MLGCLRQLPAARHLSRHCPAHAPSSWSVHGHSSGLVITSTGLLTAAQLAAGPGPGSCSHVATGPRSVAAAAAAASSKSLSGNSLSSNGSSSGSRSRSSIRPSVATHAEPQPTELAPGLQPPALEGEQQQQQQQQQQQEVVAAVGRELRPRRTGKVRLDELCSTLYPQHPKRLLQSWILQGKVSVDDKVISKAGHQVNPSANVVVRGEEQRYVCRAGYKLEKGLQHFNIDVNGKVALDSGQSTGGFTDCLLQNGAAQVIGIDVGYGQLADKVRTDPRVVVMERFNLRHLKPSHLPCLVDIACLDLSFISVLKVLPAVMGVVKPEPGAQLLVLIKPQFEAGKENVGRGGVVRDPQVHAAVIAKVSTAIQAWGFRCEGVTESPIKGERSGNTEFLAHFVRDPSVPVTVDATSAAASRAEDEPEEGEQEGSRVVAGKGKPAPRR